MRVIHNNRWPQELVVNGGHKMIPASKPLSQCCRAANRADGISFPSGATMVSGSAVKQQQLVQVVGGQDWLYSQVKQESSSGGVPNYTLNVHP